MGRMIDTDDLMQYAFGNRKGLIHTANIDKVPTAMEMLHGTLHITVDHDISDVYRVWLSQKGTHYGELYYPDYTDEEIQKMQDLEQAELDKAFELGKQAAQPEPQWISCKDRLPEVNESVLVTTEWNDISIAWRIGIDEWFIHEGSTNATTDDLAAWMPLPEPWRSESDEEKNL